MRKKTISQLASGNGGLSARPPAAVAVATSSGDSRSGHHALRAPVVKLVFFFMVLTFLGCAKPALEARVNSNVEYLVRSFIATPNEVYYAVRDALLREGYGVAREDLASGLITSTWVSTTADSHYVDLFNRRNYIINGGYYQLDIRVMPEGPSTRLEVAAVVKSAVANLRSAGKVEKRLLADVANGLRKQEPVITNLGITE